MPMGSVSATIDSSNLKKKLAAADPKIRSNISKQLNRLGTMTASGIRGKMNKDTSYMRIHVHATHATPNNLVETILSDAKYTSIQDEGSGPGTKTPLFWPNTEKMAAGGWFMRHPPPMDKETGKQMSLQSWQFLVGRAIATKGIKGHHFIDPVITPAKAQAIAFMKDALRGVF